MQEAHERAIYEEEMKVEEVKAAKVRRRRGSPVVVLLDMACVD